MSTTPQTQLTHEETIIRMLGHSGTPLANNDPGLSFLFLMSTLIEDFSFGILWTIEAGRYRRSSITISETDYSAKCEEINRSFNEAFGKFRRGRDLLMTNGTLMSPLAAALPRQLTISTEFRATYAANRILLLPLAQGSQLVEIYCKDSAKSNAPEVFSDIHKVSVTASNIYDSLHERLKQIEPALSGETDIDFREIRQNQRLFRYIVRDMKTWFGEDLRHVNMFTYDSSDHMLYHLETSHLELDPEAVEQYRSVPEIGNPDIINYIHHNIDNKTTWPMEIRTKAKNALVMLQDAESTRVKLREALAVSKKEKRTKRETAKMEILSILKALLTVMPQEPGTGIAGETALTRIPQLGKDPSDKRWQPASYSGMFFAAMLSVEQLFGIGSSGNQMAAVPLLEGGQLWGVLFMVQRKDYTAQRLLELWERAQHLSLVLSVVRSNQFRDAVIQNAANPLKSIAEIAAESIQIAFNPVFLVHWRFPEKPGEDMRVDYWKFAKKPGRFGFAKAEFGKGGYFRSKKVRDKMYARRNAELQILPVSFDNRDPSSGLPDELDELPIPRSGEIRSALMIPVDPNNLIALYSAERADILKKYKAQVEDRLSCLYDIQRIRDSNPSTSIRFVTQSRAVRAILKKIDIAARNSSEDARIILVRGDTGTGKELIAHRVHDLSTRRDKKMVVVACNALAEGVLESELFGHAEGSFTGATKERKGHFEQADKSTIFLDEIGELSSTAQSKFLRVIQQGEIQKVGGDVKKVDARIVAATNQPIETTFRKELYHRLNALEFKLPSLRERPEDIPSLARYFAEGRGLRFSAPALAAMWNFNWTENNVRQLENVIKALSVFREEKDIIDLAALPPEVLADTGRVTAKNVGSYLGVENSEKEERRGWALFSPSVYDTADSPMEDWTHFAVKAFTVLEREGLQVGSFCSMGCGAALDAVAAVNTWACQDVLLVDANETALWVGQENVLLNARIPMNINISQGMFFDAVSNRTFDLIYENLPNLPWSREGEPQETKLATYYSLPPNTIAGDSDDDWLLATHRRFLSLSKPYLNPRGSVVCCIGARIPWHAVTGMFKECGFKSRLVYFGLKEQQQPDEVIDGYAQIEERSERKSGPFMFLDLERARQSISDHTSSDPYSVLNEVCARTELHLSAVKARTEHDRGKKIGHGVFVVVGQLEDRIEQA